MATFKKLFQSNWTEAQSAKFEKTFSPYLLKKLSESLASTNVDRLYIFSGANETGKTLGAELIAKEYKCKIRHILSADFVKKYIGETEKNLARLIDEANSSNAILLFDEADALFGKRTAVKDAHDKYANQEVSYLLSRIQSDQLIVFLNVKSKANLDPRLLKLATVCVMK